MANASVNRGYVLDIIVGIFLTLALSALVARIYYRAIKTKNLGYDDFFIVVATVNIANGT
jgi:hypothetical protein